MSQVIKNLSEVLKKHKLNEQDYEKIKQILSREPNILEIAIFSSMWSEHCSYKSSKKYLNNFPTKGPHVIQGPGENAGVIDIGGGYSAVFKVESHNHPSFIEPYAGAATGVGGIMRDIFTMGARVVANLNSIRFGEIWRDDEIGKKHKQLLKGVVGGIGGYGNCMGVPTIGGEVSFEACYNGNILVNAFALGIAKIDEIFYAKAEGIGNPVIYVGSKTGGDGLGGAVMSSDSFKEDSKSLRPTVQIGDPFAEKLLLEACLELFKKDLIVGIQDMGAAGLTSSSFEMAGKSGSGMKLYLDKVPVRENGLTPYELMLSESQERMLICAKKGCENQVIEIFKKYELDVEIIGEVTDSGEMELFWHGEKCAQIPIDSLSQNAPVLDRALSEPKYLQSVIKNEYKSNNFSQQEIFTRLLGSLDVSDKSWIYSQYDSTVQTNTIVSNGMADGSVIRIKENNTFIAMDICCPIRYCYLNPREGAKIAVATAGRNCAIRGAKVLAISDCLNFGNPENPEVMWQFKEACDGIKEACLKLNTPVVSGNVSLYNQTDNIDIYPTPTIVAVGSISQAPITSDLKEFDNEIILLGEIELEFGGSLVQKILDKTCGGKIPKIDLEKELNLWNLLYELSSNHLLESAKELGKGGLSISLAKMAILGNKGIEVSTGFKEKDRIFSQSQSCAILEIKSSNFEKLKILATKYNISMQLIGKVTQKPLIKIDSICMDLMQAREIYFNSFENTLHLKENL